MPDHWRQMVRLVDLDMRQAVIDCMALDACLMESDRSPVFLGECATFHARAAIEALNVRAFAVLTTMIDPKRSAPQWVALKRGDIVAAQEKLVLHRIREKMRDGYTVQQAIQQEDSAIKRMATKGNTNFFIHLAQLLKEAESKPTMYASRPLTGWIVRAWLPLCLWECDADGVAAFAKLHSAAELLNRPEAAAPAFEKQFHAAWRNVRKRSMKAAISAARASASLDRGKPLHHMGTGEKTPKRGRP